jgi:hypothetical protein
MGEGRIRLLETLILKGPNYSSYRPCVWMRIAMGRYRERPTKTKRIQATIASKVAARVDFERQKESREGAR